VVQPDGRRGSPEAGPPSGSVAILSNAQYAYGQGYLPLPLPFPLFQLLCFPVSLPSPVQSERRMRRRRGAIQSNPLSGR
jgi:hypothetical protein